MNRTNYAKQMEKELENQYQRDLQMGISTVTMKMPTDMKEKAKDMAERDNRTLAGYIRHLVLTDIANRMTDHE